MKYLTWMSVSFLLIGVFAAWLFYFFQYQNETVVLATVNKDIKVTENHNITTQVKAVNWLFVGDIMMDRYVGTLIKKNGLSSLLDNIAGQEKKFFSDLDIVSANLESAVTDKGAHYPPVAENDFAVSPALVEQLKNYNFNYFTIANNHVADQGRTGYVETKKNLRNLGFNFSGAGDLAINDDSVTVVNVRDLKAAMIGLSMVYGDFDLEKAEKLVVKNKTENDLVIVNIHWGQEYQSQFNERQAAVARVLIDAGADLIIGHHPHVVQGIEIYKGKAIFYSLGNFLFDQYFSKATQQGLVVGAIYENGIWRFSLLPIGMKNSRLYLLTENEKEDFLNNLVKFSRLTLEFKKQVLIGKFDTK